MSEHPIEKIVNARDQIFAKLSADTPLVMGILNVTPDSFSDGARFDSVSTALPQARKMVAEGADILDIGGESTRPGGAAIDADTEWQRLSRVLARLATDISVPISLDTYKAQTAKRALHQGHAAIINDVWGLQKDPDMAAVVADHGAGLIAMHNRDNADPKIDILSDIKRYFGRSLQLAQKAGIAKEHIVLDPGIGFGKTVDQNLTILANLEDLMAFGHPILIGLSRKSFLGKILGAPVDARLTGTLVANLWSILHGADIVRVHDVAEHVAARTSLRRFRDGQHVGTR